MRLSARGRIIVVTATLWILVVIALAAGWAYAQFIVPHDARLAWSPVAGREIPRGAVVKPEDVDLALRWVGANGRPDAIAAGREEAVGRRALVEVSPGEVLLGRYLEPDARGGGGADALCQLDPDDRPPTPRVSVNELGGITATTERLRTAYGAGRVLVVFDIDNTLLTATVDFGSDFWFEWQFALLRRPSCSHLRVGDDFSELLAVQYLAYAIGEMRPTEMETVDIVRDLVDDGHPVMALTARSPETRSPTLRELSEDGITFPTAPRCRQMETTASSVCTATGTVDAETILAISRTVLTDVERVRLTESPRAISYADGVMMVSGQDKGIMLLLLLASITETIDAIVFVDDGAANVNNVDQAFRSKSSPEVQSFWYTAFELQRRAFLTDADRLDAAARTWRQLSATLCMTVGTFCGP